jgi:two-component system, NarL family, sensor histidine kinase UhpB
MAKAASLRTNAHKPVTGETNMPLRVRLIAWIGSVLLVSLGCGSVLVVWHAGKSVQTELRAALDVGTHGIQNGLADTPGDLRRLVATFDGNRHVRALLIDDQDRLVAASSLTVPARKAPGWFRRLIADAPAVVRVKLPQAGDAAAAIVLQADPTSEISEVWGESRDALAVLAGFALLTTLVIYAGVGRALRPLETLSAAFGQIGKGNYLGRVPQHSPPELMHLADSFNRMAGGLAAAAAQNRRLNERLRTLQAEERAELARDLHDEVGPMLFAVDMTAAAIERLAGNGRAGEIPAHVQSIHDAVGRMQRHVRAILERLRPLQAVGLEAAVHRLVSFWRGRRPEIDFVVSITVQEEWLRDDLKETAYRLIQEGVSNAIRHGEPTRVELVIANDDDALVVEVRDDGPGMPADGGDEDGPARLGLMGMRERVMAMSGSLSIRQGSGGKGIALVARLPCAGSVDAPIQDAAE